MLAELIQICFDCRFESADDEPNLNAREIRFNINDGIHQSDDTVRVEVQGINDRKPEVQFDHTLYFISKFSYSHFI